MIAGCGDRPSIRGCAGYRGAVPRVVLHDVFDRVEADLPGLGGNGFRSEFPGEERLPDRIFVLGVDHGYLLSFEL